MVNEALKPPAPRPGSRAGSRAGPCAGLASGGAAGTLAAMSPVLLSWLLLIFGYVLPLLHVALSRDPGLSRPAEPSRCPFSPRAGWLVIVLLLGPVGWLLFQRSRRRRRGHA